MRVTTKQITISGHTYRYEQDDLGGGRWRSPFTPSSDPVMVDVKWGLDDGTIFLEEWEMLLDALDGASCKLRIAWLTNVLLLITLIGVLL